MSNWHLLCSSWHCEELDPVATHFYASFGYTESKLITLANGEIRNVR
jgi:hypothetical protein